MAGGRLGGKVALVTGAGGAIGGAIARRFAAEGAAVSAGDIDLETAERTAGDIAGAGGRAVACALDVSVEEEAARAVALTVERFGSLTVLVNVAAAPSPDGTVVDKPFAEFMGEVTVNLGGCVLMSKYAIPEMARAGGGAIIHIASQLGHVGVPKRAAYCSSKGAILQLTRVMAIDHARDHIRVNSISPGAIDTPRALRRYGTREEANRVRGRFYLAGRTGTVDEVAAGAVYLASDEASFCTGSDLVIDGGYLAFKGTTEDI